MSKLTRVASVWVVLIAIWGTERPAAGQGRQSGNADIVLGIEPRESGIAVVSLHSTNDDREWIARDKSGLQIQLPGHVKIEGREVPVRWRSVAGSGVEDGGRRAGVVFVSDDPPLELESSWECFESGPVEHRIRLRNKGARAVLVPMLESLALTSAGELGGHSLQSWWVEKGGSTPTPAGIHRGPVTERFALNLKSGPVAGNTPRDPIPFVAIRDAVSGRGWYAGIEFSGRVRMRLGSRKTPDGLVVDATLGLPPDGEAMSRVPPGGVYEPPVVFIGCFRGDMDDCGNQLRPWVAAHLRPAVHDPKYPLLVNNSWGSGMAVDETLARSMIDESAALGLEMFHIDAGWFRSTGDWRPDPRKFPRRLRPISDYAHQKGLRFGLWVGWTQGGNQQPVDDPARVLSVRDPARANWFTENYPAGWKPADFSGATVCLADPAAEAWCLRLLRGIIQENRLDLLEHDQRMIVEACSRTDHSHTSSPADIAFRASEAYYRIYDTLRKENPNLLFEDCVNGGQMVDFGAIRRAHYISITDTYDPLSNRRAFFDASHLIPPAMCECYVEQHPGRTPANFVYMLRSGMMGWCTMMLDTARWTPRQHELARRQFAIYKTRLRPLINSAQLYHVSERPDGIRWDGIEYFDPIKGNGVLFAFRGNTPEDHHTFKLRGLDPKKTYAVACEDGSEAPRRATGEELMNDGLRMGLKEPESSELVYITAVPST